MDKKDKTGPGDDRVSASSCAAYSVASFFKKKHWEIISYFPNSVCISCLKSGSKKAKPKTSAKKKVSSKSKE